MIYDFHELLGRGIIASRSGRAEEAINYLTLAAKVNPHNTRVWLWLAASSESVKYQREFLERALEIDPDLLPAQVLLDRLNGQVKAIQQESDDFAIFTCHHCGGKQRFDPDVAGLVCSYCGQIEPLQTANAAENESALSADVEQSGHWAIGNSEFACGACGAKLSIPSIQSTVTCPFCESDQITLQPAMPGLIQPAAIVPFQFHADDVEQITRKAGYPHAPEHGLGSKAVYLPFWTFDGCVQIRCNLTYHVPPEVYSEKERVFVTDSSRHGVILSNQWVEESWYEYKVDDLLIYAGHGRLTNQISMILPFDLKSMLEYRPEILAGWQAEYYQVALTDASAAAIQKMRVQAFRSARKRSLFMREETMLADDVRVLDRTYKLILLPIWMVRYSVKGKVHRTMVNGQTGKILEKQ